MAEYDFRCQLIAQTKDSTVSALYLAEAGRDIVPGGYLGIIIEDGPREIKVKGETRIPAGRYRMLAYTDGRIFARYKQKFQHECVFLLKDVPGFGGIIPHIGNYTTDTDGCPLINSGFTMGPKGFFYGHASEAAYKHFYTIAIDLHKCGHRLFWNVIR